MGNQRQTFQYSWPVILKSRLPVLQCTACMVVACVLDVFLDHVLVYWALLAAVFWITATTFQKETSKMLEAQSKLIAGHWRQQMLFEQPSTTKESSDWLTKLVQKMWPNVLEPCVVAWLKKLVEKTMGSHKPKNIKSVEVIEFSLGNAAPEIGLGRTHWSTESTGQEVLHTGVKWSSHEMAVELAIHFSGKGLWGQKANVVISDAYVEGDLRIIPILGGLGWLYSFERLPEVNIRVSLAPGSQNLPFDILGIQAWLEQLLMDALQTAMLEPGYNLVTTLPTYLHKTAVGGLLRVTVKSASGLARVINSGGSNSVVALPSTGSIIAELKFDGTKQQTGKSRRAGPSPTWDEQGSMHLVLSDSEGLVQLELYELRGDKITCEYLGSCAIKVKYGGDGSSFFWAVGSQGKVIAGRAEGVGQPITLTVPLAESPSGTVTVELCVPEWHFASGNAELESPEAHWWSHFELSPPMGVLTGRVVRVTAVEGRGLQEEAVEEGKKKTNGAFYLRLEYGKNSRRTRSQTDPNPVWNQTFEFLEVSGSHLLSLTCWDASWMSHKSSGTSKVNLQGLAEGVPKEIRVPLARSLSGEVHLRLEVAPRQAGHSETVSADQSEADSRTAIVPYEANAGGKLSSRPDTLVVEIVEAKDLKSADGRDTMDPFVSLHYVNHKRKTKVVHRSTSPEWRQTFKFPFESGTLLLHVKDHRSLVSSQSIGHVEIQTETVPLNSVDDRWIPLKEVGGGEVHLRITRKGQNGSTAVLAESSKIFPPVEQALTTLKSVEKTSQKLRVLLQTAFLYAEESEMGTELEGLIEAVASHEDERESLVAQLQTDRELLLKKVHQLEQVMNGLL